ncbi:hypothetical protein GR158_16850 [Shinella sp. AETb1-6]|uniref:DedA family protein n=1 Tax=Shinella sp. AETb1-6 TaxID=2692210 RepID=UPI00136A61D3|nr:DedA family protein [Shinella sp. AETb1-6]MXN52785.1 hypothetical protein [Shinella sp. AETb1-6]WLS10495.1 DedA family protein [Shinella sumterensis]
MDTLLDATETFIRTHQAWAALVVGFIAFGESIVILGLIIPATALMLLIGGLVGSGIIDPFPVVTGAIVGAVLGDIVSYMMGQWLGPGVVHQWPLRHYRERVARVRLFFRKYGFLAVFFGRFFGPLRCTVPLVAGMMGMEQRRFQAANIASAVIWAPAMLAPGWLAAKGAEQFGDLTEAHWLGLAVLMTGIAILVMVVGAWFARRMAPARRRADQIRSRR